MQHTDQMGPKGTLKEAESDESGKKGGKKCQVMIGDQQLEHAGRHNEVPKSYVQWRWGYGSRSGGEN